MENNSWVTTERLDSEAIAAEISNSAAGALVMFLGTVRNIHEGKAVESMTYDCNPILAAKTLSDLEKDVCERFDVLACRLQHRFGHLQLTEASVIVAVVSAHRASAFEAARWALDTLKECAPIWKHEHYLEGESNWLPGTPLVAPNDSEAS